MRLLYQPLILSIMPTQQCTASCASCGTESHPGTRTKLSRDEIIRAIRVAASDGFRLAVFTGGEATLSLTDVEAGLAEAKALGLRTRLVTNGWWGKSASLADLMMVRLRNAGLDEINFSTGDEHARSVPLTSLFRATSAAITHGLEPLIMVEVHENATLTADRLRTCTEFSPLPEEHWNCIELLESPWMPLDPEHVASYPPGRLVDGSNVHEKDGCDSIFSTHTVRPDGKMSICCGLGINGIDDLQTGLLTDVDASYRPLAAAAECDLVKLLVREIGPERLLNEVQKLAPQIDWEGMYAHRCQACLRVFRDERVRRTVNSNSSWFTALVAENMVITRSLEQAGI